MINLNRFWKYGNSVYGLDALINELRDSRIYPEIPTSRVWKSGFSLFLLRFRSLNSWEEESRDNEQWQGWLGGKAPSADTIGYTFSRFQCAGLRKGLVAINTKLKRNKVLEASKINGLLVAAVDGHEEMASYHRCCPDCLERRIKTKDKDDKDKEQIQFYHRMVTCKIVGGTWAPLLDMEQQQAGEDEVATALRLLARVCRNYPKYFQVLVMDALYAREPVVSFARQHKKDVVIVLKDVRRDLYQDAQELFKHITRPQSGREGKTEYKLWDEEHFSTWTTLNQEVRVVRSLEKERLNQKIDGQWKEIVREHDWYWVTTLPQSKIDAQGIREIGHRRWDIENQGFNELVNHWSMDHCWKHNPVAIESLILTLFWAFNLFQAFVNLNVKPLVRKIISALSIARLLYISLHQTPPKTYWLHSAPG